MPSKHISPSANTSTPFFNCPHALKTHFTQCQHLKPTFQLPPCPRNILHPVPTPQTPFSTDPMPSKHISPSANTSNPLSNCPHALKTYFTQCQHLKSPFQLPPCPGNTFHPMPTPHTPFSTHRMPSKYISHSTNTSNLLFNSPHALKTHSTECQHLKRHFQLPPCPQSICHQMPTPHTPLSTAPMRSQHISPSANSSNLLFNSPHDLNTYFTQYQHLESSFQLTPCPQNTFHPMPTPPTPFSTAPIPSKHISPNANTFNPLFIYPHALKTYFTQCQHLKPPFELPSCPRNTFHPVSTRQTSFSTALMPSKHISPSANTSNPLFNCPHALKTHFTQWQYLKPFLQLPSCPHSAFHPTPTPQTPFPTARMPTEHISPRANTSNPLPNLLHADNIRLCPWLCIMPCLV